MRGLQTALAVLTFGTAAVLLGIGACKGVPVVAGEQTTLTLYANPASVAVGGSATLTISAFEESGQAVPDSTQITFETTRGAVEPALVETRGGFAQATFRADATPGTAEITARSGNAAAATISVVIGGNAASLSLAADPPSLPAGGGTVTLIATARDAGGVPAAGIPVTFAADHGTLASGGRPISTGSDGVARDSLTTNVDTKATAEARGVVGGPSGPSGPTGTPGGTASSNVTIDVAGVGAARLTVTASPELLGPGGGSATIRALAEDASGNPVASVAVVFTTTAGSLARLGPVFTDASGVATNTLTTSASATVTASAAGVASGSASIRVGNPTPSSVLVSLVVSPSAVTKPIVAPTPVAACSRLGSSFDVTLTATVSASGNPVAGALVVFYAQPAAVRARSAGTFCEQPPQAITNASGVAEVHWGLTSGELSSCDAIVVPCAGAVCPTPVSCPTPVQTASGQVNDCCCGLFFTAQVGTARDDATLRILVEKDCTLTPAGSKVCRCTF